MTFKCKSLTNLLANKLIALPVSAAILSGCSGVSFHTNAGEYAIDRAGSALVREYTVEQINRYEAITLGMVEAGYCQESPDAAKAHKSTLVRDLKRRTRQMGGNGVVVEACGTGGFPGCHTYLECRGVAYSVPERQGGTPSNQMPAGFNDSATW